MGSAKWFGPILIVVGLLLGAVVAGGEYAAEASNRARVTPVPSGPVAVPAPISLQGSAGDVTRGHVLYDRVCSGCHGTSGRSDTPLHGPLINAYYPDDRALAGVIRNGIGTMPETPPSDLPDQGVSDVMVYIRAFP
jgi:mono/diheme cytochrome c family protein